MEKGAEAVFDRVISPSVMPMAAGYTGAGLVNAWVTIANAIPIHHITATEAFVQISLALISTTPAIIGGVTLAGGVWLKHIRTLAEDEREYRRKVAKDEREYRAKMAELGCPIVAEIGSDFPFDRKKTAKPDDDTVEIK